MTARPDRTPKPPREPTCTRRGQSLLPARHHHGGPDHWPEDDNLNYTGRVHISLNSFTPYVDIPAHMQALTPYINAVAASSKKEDQEAADRREKLMWEWWLNARMDQRLQVITTIRALYGATAVHPYWDTVAKMPAVRIVETPENLRIGWGSNDYTRKDWALLCYWLTPQAIREDYNLDVRVERIDGRDVKPRCHCVGLRSSCATLASFVRRTNAYRVRAVAGGRLRLLVQGRQEVRHAVYVENHQVKDEERPEYEAIPYVWIPNGKLPGSPDGRSEYHDIEQLVREKETRTVRDRHDAAHGGSGSMWQLNGPDAPSGGQIPVQSKPEPNKVAFAGSWQRTQPHPAVPAAVRGRGVPAAT